MLLYVLYIHSLSHNVYVMHTQHLASKVVVYFFTLMDMAHIRHTYQFSLKWFLSLFKDSLHTCPRSNTGKGGPLLSWERTGA